MTKSPSSRNDSITSNPPPRGVLSPDRDADASEDRALRPKRFDEFIGQAKLKENLAVFVEAARRRGDALDHVLLYGPPGLGKTTLAYILSAELGVNIRSTSGPVIERPGDLAAILTQLQDRDVLFIDEIHRMPPVVEEILYPAMEDYKLDIMIGQGVGAQTLKLTLPKFTLIGATTRTGLISAPLRSRFGVDAHLQYYDASNMIQIVKRSSGLLKIEIDAAGAEEIGRRARGTPRVANRLLRRVRDFAQVKADGRITKDVAEGALNALEVDRMGLDPMDRSILSALVEKYRGGPVGLETLSIAVGEEPDTLSDVYEPFLIQIGLMERTMRGRVATAQAYHYLGKEVPNSSLELFGAVQGQ